MRTLSIEQKEHLENHIAKKPIEYIELYNELYDHYASAYEKGEDSFEATVEELDNHFHYQRVKRINDNLLKKTKKSVNEIYWKEFKNFWRWPQIISTLGILFLGIFLFEYVPIKSIVWYILVPILFFNLILLGYGSFLKHMNKIKNKKFDSAHYKATQYYLNFPSSVFNLTVFLPVLALEAGKSSIQVFEKYPIIVFALLILFMILAYIGYKVFRTKIKVQYL